MSSLFEECQVWIEKGQKSWKSYFSKWETFAKCEEDIPESELIFKVNDKRESKHHIHKKIKRPASQKRIKSVAFRKQKNKHKKIVKRRKNLKKNIPAVTNTEVLNKTPDDENLVEIIESNQFERTLKAVFSVNKNNFEVFAVLFQTFCGGEIQMKNPEYLYHEKKNVMPVSNFNLESVSIVKQQFFSSPLPKNNFGIRSICPPRDAYIQSLDESIKAVDYKPEGGGGPSEQWKNVPVESQTSVRNCWNKQRHFSFLGNMTPPSVQKLNVEVKSCPPFSSAMQRFENSDLKFETSLCQKTNKNCFKNTVISKMSITQGGKGPGTLCLHKRTNSVSLRMENSNFITPERKSSEQKGFNKIVSQRRRPSKKLFFDNEEDDSESDGETERCPSLIQNKRQKVDEPETKVADYDSDDCDAIFDRIVKA